MGFPGTNPVALAAERLEVPQDDRVLRAHVSERLMVTVAERTTVDRTCNRPAGQSEERQPTREVECDDQLDPRKRDIEPSAVRRVEHPSLTRADRLNASPLL